MYEVENENGYELVNKMNSSTEDISSLPGDKSPIIPEVANTPDYIFGDVEGLLQVDTSRKGPRDWFTGWNTDFVCLMFWEAPRRSASVFSVVVTGLLCLSWFSLISLAAYMCLLLLIATFSFRLYKTLQGTISSKASNADSHPLKALFELDLTVKPQRLASLLEPLCDPFNKAVIRARSVLLVENFAESAKFAGLMWALTYIGACFNALTLLMLIWVGLFVFPKSYEKNQDFVDALVGQLALKARVVVSDAYTAAEPKLQATIERMPPAVRNAFQQIQGGAVKTE